MNTLNKRFVRHFLTLTLVLFILAGSINFSLSSYSHLNRVSTAVYYSPEGKPLASIYGTAPNLNEWHLKLLVASRAVEQQYRLGTTAPRS